MRLVTIRNRFCYVILCHTDAPAVLTLARRVNELSPSSVVVIRHDQGPGYITATQAAAVGAELLHSDIEVNWGGWSMTAATIEAFRAGRRFGATYVTLVSGHDYPITDLAAWERDVVTSGADALIALWHEPPYAERYRYVWRETAPAPRWVPDLLDAGLAAVATRVDRRARFAFRWFRNGRDRRWAFGVRRPDPTPPIPIVTGSQWLTLDARAVDAVLHSHDENERVRRFFATTQVPDETYIQSVVSHDPQLVVLDQPTSFLRWQSRQSSPAWLTADDVPAARASGAAFARKVAADDQSFRARADDLIAEARPASRRPAT